MTRFMILCSALLAASLMNGCTGVTSKVQDTLIAGNNLASGSSAAPASAPVGTGQRPTIKNVHVAESNTSCTVTWNTNVGSDSLADLATGMGPWIPAWSQLAAATTDETYPGVTSHTATISDLWPGFFYNIYLRSRPFSGAVVDTNPPDSGWYDGTSNCNPLNDGSACKCAVLATIASGSVYDFKLGIAGTQNVVQGYDTYLQLYYADISRPSSYVSSSMDVTIGGLPPNSTVSMYDPNGFVVSFNSGTGLLKLNPSNIFEDNALHIATTPSTPVGSYVITFNAHAEQYPGVTHSYSYTLNVTGSSFPYGTPTSYPAIPAIGNKNTPGTWVYGMVTKGATSFFCTPYPTVCSNGAGCNFYDPIRAFQATIAYDTAHSITGSPSQWNSCISNIESGYLSYINAAVPVGEITAFYQASKGMANLALAGDVSARNGLFATADHAQWKTLRASMLDVGLERETNFTTETFIAANKAGDSNEAALIPIGIDYILADIDQIVNAAVSHEPFLDGTLADTLIHYYIDNGSTDARIPIAIKALGDHLWINYWISGVCSGSPSDLIYGCFAYSAGMRHMGIDYSTNLHSYNDADLNLLIAPMYAWLFKMTGNGTIPGSDGSQCGGTRGQPCTYQQAGDTIFQKGLSQSDYYDTKTWAQNYRWSFDYVTWRSAP
jgi:hypothetical protein